MSRWRLWSLYLNNVITVTFKDGEILQLEYGNIEVWKMSLIFRLFLPLYPCRKLWIDIECVFMLLSSKQSWIGSFLIDGGHTTWQSYWLIQSKLKAERKWIKQLFQFENVFLNVVRLELESTRESLLLSSTFPVLFILCFM